ncbi:MAG: hypothetical protein RL385_2462, partial [Pseudomonadota bacterium]
CVRPGSPGSLSLLQLDHKAGAWSVGAELVIASVGPAARGVAIAAHEGGVSVLFHDASAEAHRISLSTLNAAVLHDGGPVPSPTVLSKADEISASPAIHVRAGKVFYAYVRWDLQLDTQRAALVVRRVGSDQEYTLPLHHHEAAPALNSDGEGLLLTFRDRPTREARVEQFVLRVGTDLRGAVPPRRVGRASGLGGPTLLQCGGRTYAAAPIEHGSELYVIFHGLDSAFRAIEPNHQCYATERSLVSVAAACSGSQLLALVAEETDPSEPSAELFGMRFGCRP